MPYPSIRNTAAWGYWDTLLSGSGSAADMAASARTMLHGVCDVDPSGGAALAREWVYWAAYHYYLIPRAFPSDRCSYLHSAATQFCAGESGRATTRAQDDITMAGYSENDRRMNSRLASDRALGRWLDDPENEERAAQLRAQRTKEINEEAMSIKRVCRVCGERYIPGHLWQDEGHWRWHYCGEKCRAVAAGRIPCGYCRGGGEWPEPRPVSDPAPVVQACGHCLGTGWELCRVCEEHPAEKAHQFHGLESIPYSTCAECARAELDHGMVPLHTEVRS